MIKSSQVVGGEQARRWGWFGQIQNTRIEITRVHKYIFTTDEPRTTHCLKGDHPCLMPWRSPSKRAASRFLNGAVVTQPPMDDGPMPRQLHRGRAPIGANPPRVPRWSPPRGPSGSWRGASCAGGLHRRPKPRPASAGVRHTLRGVSAHRLHEASLPSEDGTRLWWTHTRRHAARRCETRLVGAAAPGATGVCVWPAKPVLRLQAWRPHSHVGGASAAPPADNPSSWGFARLDTPTHHADAASTGGVTGSAAP